MPNWYVRASKFRGYLFRMELAQKIKLTDWSMAGNLCNRSSGVKILRDICTRLKHYLYSAKCRWIIKNLIWDQLLATKAEIIQS